MYIFVYNLVNETYGLLCFLSTKTLVILSHLEKVKGKVIFIYICILPPLLHFRF